MRTRGEGGVSLIEAVFVVFITGLLTAAVLGTAAIQNATNFRAFNKMSALIAARRIESVIEKEIHMAKFFGDQWGDPNSSDPVDKPNVFPCTSNPYGFTNFPTDNGNAEWTANPYVLDEQTLIIQTPIFDANGYATQKNGYWNVDTYVYKVLADKSKPGSGQFVMQKALFPGDHPAGYSPPISQDHPQTVLTGIVGPINPSDAVDSTAGVPLPAVFSYYLKNSPTWSTTSYELSNPPPNAYQTSLINGVVLNLELFSNENSSRKDYTPKTVAFRSEFYKRTNGDSP